MLNEAGLSRADLNLLVLFEAVLSERHVGRAAGRLNLTPSAVSHGLGRLRALLNDPLFLRTPKGVVPTARAQELAEAVSDILARAGRLFASAAPFDAATSSRRFVIGMPDGVSAVLLQPLFVDVQRIAPRVDVGVRYLHHDTALAELEARTIDIAVVPLAEVPPRFDSRPLYEDDLALALRVGHPFISQPTLKRYSDLSHIVISITGEPRGFADIDRVLAERGLTRRVALTVPNFMLALSVIGETDLVGAMPRGFIAMHGPRFGVTPVKPPVQLRSFPPRIIVPKVAMMDAGIAWLVAAIERAAGAAHAASSARRRK
jgi:DNA-binding transcriptional LysR family regulator